MDITLNAVKYRNGVPSQTTLELTKRADGTWRAKNFDSVLRSAAQSRDTYSGRTKLSDQEIAELARKYDLRSMTQDQYDAFLDDLANAGALSRFDAMKLGYHGWNILDINAEDFASGDGGSACVTSGGDQPLQSLEDADGDLVRWLESMLAQRGKNKEPLNILYDIVKRMWKV